MIIAIFHNYYITGADMNTTNTNFSFLRHFPIQHFLICFSIYLVAFILTCIPSSAQIPDYLMYENKSGLVEDVLCSHKEKYAQNRTMSGFPSFIDKRPYDVVSYDLFLDWTGPLSSIGVGQEDRSYNGTNTIVVVAREGGLEQLEFDSEESAIDKVTIDGSEVTALNHSGGILTIDLPHPAMAGDTLTVEIDYTYIGAENDGFYLYPKGLLTDILRYEKDSVNYIDSVYTEERIAYTMSEPEDARKWMPCNDRPYDKADVKINIEVPAGFTAASNGLLDSIEDLADSRIYHWRSTKPMTTYLMLVAASKYYEWSEWYTKVTNPEERVEVKYYAWEGDFLNDSAGPYQGYNARRTLKTIVPMMEYFSELFVEYPFAKNGFAAIQPFRFGGMEHQTINTVNRSWLKGSNDYGFAHEMVHQWIGDLITCATWADIWINEGGASWGEALWARHQYGQNSYYNRLLIKRNRYMRNAFSEPPIYNIDIGNLFNGATTYHKSSWVYHMLMDMIGEEDFFPAFRNLLNTFAYKSLTTYDFVNFFKNEISNPDIDFDTFFVQWLEKPGHPVYLITSGANAIYGGMYDVRTHVSQYQKGVNVPEVFVVPLTLIYLGEDGQEHREKFINDRRLQVVKIELPFMPVNVVIDTNSVLCEYESLLTTRVAEPSVLNNSAVFPNPVKRGETGTLTLDIRSFSPVSIIVYDQLGNLAEQVYQGVLNEGSFDFNFRTNNLSQGVYYIKSIVNGHTDTKVFTIIN